MNDKSYNIISHCISCPNCGESEFYRCPIEIDGIEEVSCLSCDAIWYEHEYEDDEDVAQE